MYFVHLLAQLVRHPVCSVRHWLGGDMTQPVPRSPSDFRLKYEPEYDLLTVWLGKSAHAECVKVERGVYVTVDRSTNAVLGLEILEASARLGTSAENLRNPNFVATLVAKYGRAAATSDLRPAFSR